MVLDPPGEVLTSNNREIKFDVTWPYVKRQTAKMTSEFLFFSSNPSLNHRKIEKCLLLIATNTNIFTLLFNELKTDGKSFIFAVCRLTYDRVTSNLISLFFACVLRHCRGMADYHVALKYQAKARKIFIFFGLSLSRLVDLKLASNSTTL